jgi:GT2 family glycosyltransferase
MHPLVSVIVVSYNSGKFLKRLLNSLLQTKCRNFEIIIVDNASSDGSLETISKAYVNENRLKIIKLPYNLGFSKGNNIGANAAQGKLLVFLNADIEVRPNWLHPLIQAKIQNHSIGAVQPKLMCMFEKNKYQNIGNLLDEFGFARSRADDTVEMRKANEHADVCLYGAAFMIDRELFFALGGFDPHLALNYEDSDLSWRIWLKGFRTIYCPHSVIYHAEGVSVKKIPLTVRLAYAVHNQLYVLTKNYSGFKGLLKVFRLIPVFIAAAIFFAIKGSFHLSFSFLRGIIWYFKGFRSNWKAHLFVENRIRRIEDKMIIGNKLFRESLSAVIRMYYKNGFGYRQNGRPEYSAYG